MPVEKEKDFTRGGNRDAQHTAVPDRKPGDSSTAFGKNTRRVLAMACSFCGERANKGYLVAGPPPVAICGECVTVCVSVIQQAKYETENTATAAGATDGLRATAPEEP